MRRLRTATAALLRDYGCASLGLVGLGPGGGLALDAATAGVLRPHAVALICPSSYALPNHDGKAGSGLGALAAPMLAIFGDQDRASGATPADARDLEAAIGAATAAGAIPDGRSMVCKGRPGGFVHRRSARGAKGGGAEAGDGDGDGDSDGWEPPPWKGGDEEAADAFLLTTAWLDLYNRPRSGWTSTAGERNMANTLVDERDY